MKKAASMGGSFVFMLIDSEYQIQHQTTPTLFAETGA
jgi:hypothetical protein